MNYFAKIMLLAVLATFSIQSYGQFTTTPQTINSTGGTDGSGDLRLIVANDATVNIYYDGREQTYNGKGLVLNVRFSKGTDYKVATLAACSVASATGGGTDGSPWKVLATASITSPYDNTRKYIVNYTIIYSKTWNYFVMDYEIIGPEAPSNGESLHLYFLEDTRISGGDCGAGFVKNNTANTKVQAVGVYRDVYTASCNGANQNPIKYPVAHCLKASELGFDSYYTAYYASMPGVINATVSSNGIYLNNTVNSTISIDNGIAAHLNFGEFANSEVKTRRVANCYGEFNSDWDALVVQDPTESAAGSDRIYVEFVSATGQGAEGDTNHDIEGVSVRVSGGVLTVPMSVKMIPEAGGTATANDFAYQDAFLIPAGNYTTPKTLTINNITIKGNTKIEGDRTIKLRLASCGGFMNIGTQATTTYTIKDDDCDKYTLSFSPNPVDAGSTAVATVALNSGVTIASGITLNLSVGREASSTAIAGTHFTATLPQILALSSATTSRTFNISTMSGVGSSRLDLKATPTITGTNVTCVPTAKTASLEIKSRNITVSVDEPSIEEGGGAAGTATITAKLDGTDLAPANISFTLTYAGTAINGTDYTAATTITILSGQNYGTVNIVSKPEDYLIEGDETITVTTPPSVVVSGTTYSIVGGPLSVKLVDKTDGAVSAHWVSDAAEPNTKGKVMFKFQGTGATAVKSTYDVKVKYKYEGLPATNNYTPDNPAEAIIQAGQNSVTVEALTPVDNYIVEGSRQVKIVIDEVKKHP